jgi:hypothetical protein
LTGFAPIIELTGISFLTSNFNSFHRSKGFSLQGFSRHRSTVFPAVPKGTGFASGEHATYGITVFPGRIRRHFPRQSRAVIDNCCSLRLALSRHPPGYRPTRRLIEKAFESKHRLLAWPSHWPRQQLPNVPLQMVVGRKADRITYSRGVDTR